MKSSAEEQMYLILRAIHTSANMWLVLLVITMADLTLSHVEFDRCYTTAVSCRTKPIVVVSTS